jgi:hypothetical protein
MRKAAVILLLLLGMDYLAWAEGSQTTPAPDVSDSQADRKVSSPPPSIHAVVIENYKTAQNNKGKAISFDAGALIWIARSSDDGKVLADSKLNYLQQNDILIPRKYVATKESFVKVTKWAGANHVTVDEGPDLSYEYTIKPDGRVEVFTGNDDPGKAKPGLGHLYRFKNIVWLRIKNDDLWQEAIFVVLPGGDLCVPGSDGCNVAN